MLCVQLFSDPKLSHLYRYFQAGAVAAYEHVSMIKLHYSMADALDECIVKLSGGKSTLQERPNVIFKPLRPNATEPPPIAEEDVAKVTPRVSHDIGSAINSYESLTSLEDDYEDESNWMPL